VTRNRAEAILTVSSAVAPLGLAAVSLEVYLGHSGPLIWIFVGLALVTFVYSLGRYTQVAGRRTARISLHKMWSHMPRAWRVFLVVCIAWAAAVIAIGDHIALETPATNNGHYVTTRYGHIVRYISKAEYRDLNMGRFRLFGGVAGVLAAVGTVISAARSRVEVPDGHG
jgi:hypothetical protein